MCLQVKSVHLCCSRLFKWPFIIFLYRCRPAKPMAKGKLFLMEMEALHSYALDRDILSGTFLVASLLLLFLLLVAPSHMGKHAAKRDFCGASAFLLLLTTTTASRTSQTYIPFCCLIDQVFKDIRIFLSLCFSASRLPTGFPACFGYVISSSSLSASLTRLHLLLEMGRPDPQICCLR